MVGRAASPVEARSRGSGDSRRRTQRAALDFGLNLVCGRAKGVSRAVRIWAPAAGSAWDWGLRARLSLPPSGAAACDGSRRHLHLVALVPNLVGLVQGGLFASISPHSVQTSSLGL